MAAMNPNRHLRFIVRFNSYGSKIMSMARIYKSNLCQQPDEHTTRSYFAVGEQLDPTHDAQRW